VSRKRGKKLKPAVEAVPDDVLAEGSGPVRRADVDAVVTVEDVVTTADIATTEDVVTADDIVATAVDPAAVPDDPPAGAQDAGELIDDRTPRSGRRRRRRPATEADTSTAAPDAAATATADDDVELVAASDIIDATDDTGVAADTSDTSDSSDLGSAGEVGDPSAEGDPDLTAGEAGEGDPSAAGGDGDEDDAGIVFPTSAATMDAVQLKHLVEALIFASDRPLTVQRLRQLTRVGDTRRLEHALLEIAEDFRDRGLILQQVSGGYQFRTRTQFSAWVQQLIAGRPVRLSRAQLETLAIIAYRQPITRPEIDDIRGVDSSATLKLLIDRMLIRILGKREEVGRPMLYGTTKEFLDFFSLGDLRELPTLREYSELTAESRKVMSDRLGIAPDDGDGNNGSGGNGSGGDDGGNGGGSGGGGFGGGGIGGGGFDGGDGGGGGGGPVADDDGAPANASVDDLADAVATFLSAADAVDRSDAAAVAEADVVADSDDDRPRIDDIDDESGALGVVAAPPPGETGASDRETEAVFAAGEGAAFESDAVAASHDPAAVESEPVPVDDDAVVFESEAAVGENCVFAVGDDAVAVELEAVAVETNTFAVGHDAVAVELEAVSSEPHVFAVGDDAVAIGDDAVVGESEAVAVESEVVAVENHVFAVDDDAVVFESEAAVGENHAFAIGDDAVAVESQAVAVESEVVAVETHVFAVDDDAVAVFTADNEAVAFGSEPVELGAEPGALDGEPAEPAADGRDGDADGWAAGSQVCPIIASGDDRPVERPVMDSNVIEARALDDSLGDGATAAASHVEPAAE
jgi:segregation and condensation protein B